MKTRLFPVLTMLTALAVFGCNDSTTTTTPDDSTEVSDDHGHDHDDHDHDDHGAMDSGEVGLDVDELPNDGTDENLAETYPEGVKQASELIETLQKGLSTDGPDSVHHELHSVGNVLVHLEQLAKDAELDEANKKQALTAIEGLLDAFTQVDLTLHGDSGEDYDSVKGDIDTALENLKATIK